MPFFLKITVPLMVLLLFHFFYLNGKKLIKDQNLYRLENVSFVGVEESDPYEIIRALELKRGINLLLLDTDKLTEKLKTIPRYKNAEVFLKYPNTLILKIEEKKPAYIIKVKEKMYSINRYGDLTERDHEIKNYDLFFIEVLDFNSLQEVLENQKFKKFIKYAQAISEEEKNIFQIFSGIEFSRFNKDWILYGYNKGVRFNLGKNLSFNKLRKTRYAYIYKNYKNISTKNIFITEDFVYYNL